MCCNMSLTSIVIPAYNAGRYIRRALEGVRAQTNASWEAIVVEDGSRDGTESIVTEFSSTCRQRVVYENNGVNCGVSQSRNRGLALSRGDVIAFLDADDWWLPEHLATGTRSLSPEIAMCVCGFHIYSDDESKVIDSVTPSAAQLKYPVESMFSSNFIQTASLMILQRKVSDALSGFDVNLKVGEDCDYWMRALGKGFRLGYSQHISCYYAKHAASAMAKTMMVAEQTVRFYKKHLSSYFVDRDLRRMRLAESLVNHGRLLWKTDARSARRLLCEALRYQPLNGLYLGYALASCLLAPFSPRSDSHFHASPIKSL